MKKTLLMICMVLAAGLLEVIWSSEAIARRPKSYPLVCRGGGNMAIVIKPLSRQLRGRLFPKAMFLTFSKSPYGASQRQPGPGQCAWLDRGMYQTEPSGAYIGAKPRIKNMRITQNRTYVLFENQAHEYVHKGVAGGTIFYLHAYREGRVLKVTRFGP